MKLTGFLFLPVRFFPPLCFASTHAPPPSRAHTFHLISPPLPPTLCLQTECCGGWKWHLERLEMARSTALYVSSVCSVLFHKQYFSESCQPPPALCYSVVTVTSQQMPTAVDLRQMGRRLLWYFKAHPSLCMWMSKGAKGGLLCYHKQFEWSKRSLLGLVRCMLLLPTRQCQLKIRILLKMLVTVGVCTWKQFGSL